GVQEKIFSLLERNNLFIVGDGKQSIYGFRGCDNTIFEERIKRAKPEELVRLDKNFRSSRAVIDFVNKVFSAVMTTNTFGENYADNPMIYGELYPEDYGICEIVGFSKSKSAKKIFDRGVYGVKKHLDFMREERGAGEEDKVVEIIDKVYGKEYSTVDKSGNVVKKKIGFADIAVLTRTSKDLSDRIVDTLIACGVPVASNSRRSIGEYPEIKTVSAILYTILDDGRDDYRLATALKSPVGNLTDDQLAAIRKAFKDGTFRQAVNAYRTERIDDITIKLNEFFDYIARLRLYSDFEGVGKILRRLVKDKRLDLHLLSGRFGQVRLNRLERLIAECEKEGEAFTLASYAESEESLLKNLYVNFSEGENAVKVMNVHQSKGLEFPVVIVCELGKNFYKADAGNKLIMSRKHGLGIDHYDYATKVKTPTIVKKYLEELNKKTTLSEAVRLFYVALTRAKFALYLLVDGELKAERTAGEETSACCWKDFLCSSDAVFIPDSGENEQLKPMQKTVERQVVLPPNADKNAYDRIKKYFDYRYPFAEDVNLSVKRTVTEVARKFFESDFERTEQPVRTVFNSDAREIGTTYHSFLEKCDFYGEDAKTQLDKLVESGKMSESQRALMDDALLDRILKGRLPELVKGYDLYREQPFICLVPSEKIGEAGGGQTLIQGVIDLLAVRKDQAVIVDYKYSVKSDKALVESYGKQLELYAFAAEKVLGKKVGAVYLFNIRSNSLIPIE
ncbi:MAG: PD-(D/E)XK nuclease family protein, partial [Clostridia bacterium]|nr:PD-(D/E)XK nuclease family protein [Clostridia bacterium]